jgi:hypothetical protein
LGIFTPEAERGIQQKNGNDFPIIFGRLYPNCVKTYNWMALLLSGLALRCSVPVVNSAGFLMKHVTENVDSFLTQFT